MIWVKGLKGTNQIPVRDVNPIAVSEEMRKNLPVPLYSPPSAYKELRDKLTQLEKRLDSRVCKGFPFEKIGVTFTRWGRTKCPKDNTELVYSGFVGGSYFTHKGAAVDYLCMPEKPELDGHKYKNGTGGDKGYVYGAEYETYDNSIRIDKPHHNHDVPCVVCRIVASASVLMIPGYYAHDAASQYICLDKDAEKTAGTSANKNGKLLYPVEARCGSLPCPPYFEGRELACVVCSR